MPKRAPDQSSANMQRLADRHARTRPNTAYRGSCVNDCNGFMKLVRFLVFLIAVLVGRRIIKLFLQR